MISNELSAHLDKVSARVTAAAGFWLLDLVPTAHRRYGGLLDDLADLRRDVLTGDDPGTCHRRLQGLEIRFRRMERYCKVYPLSALIIALAVLAGSQLQGFDAWSDLTALLFDGNSSSSQKLFQLFGLLLLSVMGLALYLLTGKLADTASGSESDDPFAKTQNFWARLAIAIIMPLSLIMLIFNTNGEAQPSSAEMLSFATGYSVKLVIDLLNKMVEKASTLIRAL